MVIPVGVYPDAAANGYGALTAYPQGGTYGDILNSVFIGADAAQKQALWSSFMWSKGLTIPPDNDSLSSDLVTYIQNYSSYFPKEATTYPTTGPYGSILQAYYGSSSDENKQAIWEQFLQSQGLSNNPTDNTQLAAFVQFISGSYQASAATQTLSPLEIQKRQTMLQAFNAVLEMLNTIQNTVSVQSNNLVFYSKLQQAYTQMLTATPVYVPSPTNTWKPSTDPTSFTFGYASISVDDLAGYMAQAQANGTNASFSLSTVQSPPVTPPSTLTYTFQLTNGQPTITISSIIVADLGGGNTGTSTQSANITVPATTIATGADPFTSYKSTWSTAIMNAITQPPFPYTYSATTGMGGTSLGAPFSFGALTIPWRDVEPYPDPTNGTGTINSAQSQADTNASEARSDLNSQLQQYIANTRAQRTTVQTAASAAQNNLSLTKTAISNQADLLTSVLQTITTLVSSIYR